MIPDFAKAWAANQEALRNYIAATPMEETAGTYEDIVRIVFGHVVNPYLVAHDEEEYDLSNMTVIDHGDYQGTTLYVIPLKTYQPTIGQYVWTHNFYGSCSGCDTLLGITQYDWSEKPNHQQVSELMTLCLHILQRCTILDYTDPTEETLNQTF